MSVLHCKSLQDELTTSKSRLRGLWVWLVGVVVHQPVERAARPLQIRKIKKDCNKPADRWTHVTAAFKDRDTTKSYRDMRLHKTRDYLNGSQADSVCGSCSSLRDSDSLKNCSTSHGRVIYYLHHMPLCYIIGLNANYVGSWAKQVIFIVGYIYSVKLVVIKSIGYILGTVLNYNTFTWTSKYMIQILNKKVFKNLILIHLFLLTMQMCRGRQTFWLLTVVNTSAPLKNNNDGNKYL